MVRVKNTRNGNNILKRFLCLFSFAILITLLSSGVAFADRYAPYEFDLHHIPRWGEGSMIDGTVYSYGSKCVEEGLYVKLFLQVEGDETWWPKPTGEEPFAPVFGSDFSITFNTGGEDVNAVKLALMLVREKDIRLLDYDEANAAALCVTTIDRKPDGTIELSHSYRADKAWLEDIGMCVGFYTQPGSQPGDPLSDAQIEAILRAAAAYTCNVRFYSTTGEIAKAYPMSKELGLHAAATAWLDGSEHDREELDALIELCNSGLADMAFVGNESLYAGRLSEDELLEDLAYVREGIKDREIPVTTAETAEFYLGSRQLRDACDVLAVNVYPFHEGAEGEESESGLHAVLDGLIECAPGKRLVISETGWPTAGDRRADTDAQLSAIEAAYDAVWQYGVEYGFDTVSVYWFELADEPWKSEQESGVGGHWGLLDQDLNAKSTVYGQYWNWYADNDFEYSDPEESLY